MAQEKKDKKVKRPTAVKRDIQSKKRRLANKGYKARVRTAIRRFEETLSKGDQSLTKQSLNDVYSILDKSVKSGVFKINKASRTKARLAARAVAQASAA